MLALLSRKIRIRLIAIARFSCPALIRPNCRHAQELCIPEHFMDGNEQPIKESRLQVQTNLSALAEVLQWFEQFNSLLLPHNLWWQSQVALTEGFTNAVRHAHQHLPETTPIDIEVKVFTDFLEMRIWDWGKPFDLAAMLQKLRDLDEPDPLEREGGRGLMFMDQLTDELDYARMPDRRNCLVMKKRIDS